MKARKTLIHSQLQAEVMRQISTFHPDPKMIKQRLENLIEREYIARDIDKENVRSYVYIP